MKSEIRNNGVLRELIIFCDNQEKLSEELLMSRIQELSLKNQSIHFQELLDSRENIGSSKLNSLVDSIVQPILNLNEDDLSVNFLGRKYFSCQKELYIAESLNSLNYKNTALFIAERLAKKADKYFFLQLSFQAYRIIYTVYNRLGDLRKENQAKVKFLKYLEYYTIERKIELARNNLFSHYNKSTSSDEKLIIECDKIIKDFEEHENNIPSYYFHNYLYYVKYVKYVNERNHTELFENAKKAFNYFDSLPFSYRPGKILFAYIQIVYCIQKKDFATGESLIENTLTYVNKNTSHWLRLYENKLLLYLHKGDYNKASETFFSTINHSAMKLLPRDKQRWLLYEAYIRIILEVDLARFENRKKHFSIQKFINDLPIFSADKRAGNIPVLIAQMLFLIIRKEYNKAIDRIEALEKYSSRYLRNDDTFRSNCFIKMLLVVPKQGFNRKAVERHAKKYYDRLIHSEIELIDQPFEIEIIPYENLWALLLDHLSQKHHFGQRRDT